MLKISLATESYSNNGFNLFSIDSRSLGDGNGRPTKCFFLEGESLEV